MKTIWMSWILWKSLGMLKDPQNTHWELLFKLLGIFSICRVGNSHIHLYIQLYYRILKILIFIYFETFDVSWTLLLFLTNFILFRTVPLVFRPLLYLSERIPLTLCYCVNQCFSPKKRYYRLSLYQQNLTLLITFNFY